MRASIDSSRRLINEAMLKSLGAAVRNRNRAMRLRR